MSDKKDVVIRISRQNHKRLKGFVNDGETTNQIMKKMLDAMELVANGKMIFISNNKIFTDIAEARGESIMSAVKDKAIPIWPEIALVFDEDKGELSGK